MAEDSRKKGSESARTARSKGSRPPRTEADPKAARSEKAKRKKRALRIRGLRQRWIVNTIAPVAILLLLVVTLFSAGIASYYYANMQKGLEVRAQAAADSFNSYFMTSYSEYYQKAASYTDTFEDRDHIELQFINSGGRIQLSASNLTVGLSPGTDDITDAIAQGKMSVFQGKDSETKESILAVSYPLTFNGGVVGVMRFVTSLREVNRQILFAVLAVIAIAGICMALVVISSVLFINNVVEPVAVVSEAAKRISAGSYGVQIENKYTDELGQLVDNINDMSLKISQSEKMKSEFISSVSHELRTPLTAINGWGETILAETADAAADAAQDPAQDAEETAQMRNGIRIIVKESRRLTTMVEELLEFSRMEDGRFTLQVEPMDLQAEFEDAIFTYRELFRQEGIELEYDGGDEELPPIPGDPERLKQVFCNVLDNAAKHGGSGKRITASVGREEDMAVIRVRDYGPGIPEAELPFVKQKFYKGSSKARGSGIGLAVCDEILKLHNGAFDIGNAEGGGCEVTIRLPMKDE
jgi:signal transduction histidine kinase